jgi:hypothetical protein
MCRPHIWSALLDPTSNKKPWLRTTFCKLEICTTKQSSKDIVYWSWGDILMIFLRKKKTSFMTKLKI